MSSILEELIYGSLPTNPPPAPNSARADAMVISNNLAAKLLAKLNDEEKALFEKLIDITLDIVDLTAKENFADGYRRGLMVTAEAFITTA